MLDHARTRTISWATALAVAFAVLAFTVNRHRHPLGAVDDWGRGAEDWADGHPALVAVLRLVEHGLGTVGMTVLTAVLVLALVVHKHRRAALYAVLAMVVTSLATTATKLLFSRARPDWQDSVDLLTTKSFPSGHASSATAFAVILAVLAAMLVRRANLRRAAYAGCALLALVSCLDRVLLGRHYPTDVLGGVLLGGAIALLGLVAFDPRPRMHAEKEDLPEVFLSEKKLHVVLNPIKVEDAGQFRAIVTQMAVDSGWSRPVWHYTTVEDPGTGMAEAAAIGGADLVLVCGGDGTVREVCAELAGTGVPVGIVPAGTGNLLARNLDIPLYLRSAIDVGLNGQDRAIDLVEVSGDGLEDSHFMVMAGMGFDAAIMEGVNEDIKAKVGWFAYVISALKSLMFPAVRVEVQVDDDEATTHRARTVLVGNVGYLQAGMPLLPDAAIDDGRLDVVILHPQRFWSWVPLVWRVLAKRPRVDETINRMTGRTVVVRASHDTPRQLDGDSIGAGKELRMECIHGKLLVRVPR